MRLSRLVLAAAAGLLALRGEAAAPEARILSGAQKLVGPAVRLARSQWRPDACFVGLDARHQARPNDSPNPRERWVFLFYSPSGGPNAFAHAVFDGSWRTVEARGTWGRHCVTEMSVDSGEAVAAAIRKGLLHGPRIDTHLQMAYVGPDGYGLGPDLLHRLPRTRDKTVWLVYTSDVNTPDRGQPRVVVDAKTGKVLSAGHEASSWFVGL